MTINLEKEIWLSVLGYEGSYEISNMGRIKSLSRLVYIGDKKPYLIKERILKQQKCTNGYLFVNLCKDGVITQTLVHRIVAIHFLENKEDKPEVNHKCGIKTDNRASELEWNTHSENGLHAHRVLGRISVPKFAGTRGSLNPRSKKVLLVTTGEIFESSGEAGRRLGIHQANISRYCLRGTKTRGGLSFKYI